MIVIRLSRVGKRNQAIFRIVVAEKEKSAKGKFIEALGTYNPRSEKDNLKINQERIEYWIGKGAQPSFTMSGILKKEGILPDKLVKEYDRRIEHMKKFKKAKKKKEEVKSELKTPDTDKKEEKKELTNEKPSEEKEEKKQAEKS